MELTTMACSLDVMRAQLEAEHRRVPYSGMLEGAIMSVRVAHEKLRHYLEIHRKVAIARGQEP